MRVQVHDFGGYAFVADLSERLAALGHEVDHVYSEQYSSNVGDFVTRFRDAERLTVTPLIARAPAEKYSALGRVRFELAYAAAWYRHCVRTRPDVVVTANMPLFTLATGALWLRLRGTRRVLWHQDVVSLAMAEELDRKLPSRVAALGARVLERIEAATTRGAASVIAISEAFMPVYKRWRIREDRVRIVRNWAPLHDISPRSRTNPFALEQGLGERPRVVYAGTLGRKHRPELLVEFAAAMSRRGRPVDLVVVSEGAAAEALRDVDTGASSVRLVPFQPASRLPDVLGTADVLIALLEPGAALFSVPSKVVTYLAAGRPVIGLMDPENSAAVDINRCGGFVAPPARAGAESAADWLVDAIAGERLGPLGVRARMYAEQHFDAELALEALTHVISGSRESATPTL